MHSRCALNDEERDAVLLALDDERQARATYAAVLQRYGPVRPFSNVIEAEKRHIAALEAVLRRYGCVVPCDPYIEGTKSIEAVAASVADACRNAVAAEIENDRLYRERLIPAVSAFPDIVAVFERLAAASRERHLPAFKRRAGRSLPAY